MLVRYWGCRAMAHTGAEARMHRLLISLMVLMLGACASTPIAEHAPELFRDKWLKPGDEPIDGAAVFALSAPIHHYQKDDITRPLPVEGPHLGSIPAMQAGGNTH